jgi:hypothetical protein
MLSNCSPAVAWSATVSDALSRLAASGCVASAQVSGSSRRSASSVQALRDHRVATGKRLLRCVAQGLHHAARPVRQQAGLVDRGVQQILEPVGAGRIQSQAEHVWRPMRICVTRA